jgi:hypothetical protein
MLSSELRRLQSLGFSDKVSSESEVSATVIDDLVKAKVSDQVTQKAESVRKPTENQCVATSKSTPQRYYKEITTYGKITYLAS